MVISTTVEDAEVVDADKADVAAMAANASKSTVGPMDWVAIMGRDVIIPCTGIKLIRPWKAAYSVKQKDAVHDGVG